MAGPVMAGPVTSESVTPELGRSDTGGVGTAKVDRAGSERPVRAATTRTSGTVSCSGAASLSGSPAGAVRSRESRGRGAEETGAGGAEEDETGASPLAAEVTGTPSAAAPFSAALVSAPVSPDAGESSGAGPSRSSARAPPSTMSAGLSKMAGGGSGAGPSAVTCGRAPASCCPDRPMSSRSMNSRALLRSGAPRRAASRVGGASSVSRAATRSRRSSSGCGRRPGRGSPAPVTRSCPSTSHSCAASSEPCASPWACRKLRASSAPRAACMGSRAGRVWGGNSVTR